MNIFEGFALGTAVVFSSLASASAPPPDFTVSEWADTHRVISSESGSRHPGPWKTARTPYLREIMDCMGVNHPSARVAVRGGAQSGKTQGMNNAIGHMIDTAPRSCMVMAPSIEKANAWNREQWQPMLDVTEALQLKVLGTRSRNEDGSSSFFKRFRGGFMKLVTASSAKNLQSSTIGLLVLEEPTDYPLDADGRGDPIDQARHRLDAWGEDGKEIAASTPGDKGACRISDMVEAGDYRIFYLQCRDCEAYSPLAWEHMRCEKPDMAGERAAPYFARPCCGSAMHQGDLAAALATGVWIKTYDSEAEGDANPSPPLVIEKEELSRWQARGSEGRYPSFHIWQAYSPFSSWRKIWEEWEAGQANPDKLRTFYQQVLAEPFEPAMDRPKAERLVEVAKHPAAAKLLSLRRGEIPPWACILTGAADVQTDRIEWAAYAWGPSARGENAPGVPAINGGLIDWGVIPISPDDPQAWAELRNLRGRTWPGARTVPLTFDRFGVDTGGHHTRQAYRVAAAGAGILALKGHTDREAAPLTMGKRVKVDIGRAAGRVQLYLVGTHNLKRRVYFGLGQGVGSIDLGDEPGALAAGTRGTNIREPGALFLPPEIEDAQTRQLTAEYLVEKVLSGRRVLVWDKPKAQANEQLDLAVYSMALGVNFGIDRLTHDEWRAMFAARARPEDKDKPGPLEALWAGNGETPEPINDAPAREPLPSNPRPAREVPKWVRDMSKRNK